MTFQHAVAKVFHAVHERDAADPADLGMDIAWNGQVDDQQRPPGASRLEAFDMAFLEQVVRGVARRQDDVDLVNDVADGVEADRTCAERPGNPIRAFDRTRGHINRSDALVAQETQRDLAHGSGAHEQHAAAAEVPQHLRGHGHRRMTDRDRTTPEFGFVAGAPSRADGAVEDDLQPDLYDPRRACAGQRRLDLAENLGLTDDHRVEAARHPK